MDEHFKNKRIWIGAGVAAIIFLCLMLCGMGTMAMAVLRSGPAYGGAVPYVQPPAGEEGAVPPPPAYNYVHGPMGRQGNFGPFSFVFGAIGALFKLAFFGLLLLLLLGLVKRIFWGRHHWAPYWGPHGGARYRGKPPKGEEWKGKPHHHMGPWAWHCGPWRPDAEPTEEEGEPDETESEYTGPQE